MEFITFMDTIIGSGIFATIVGVLIGYWLSLKASKNQRYYEAASQFREAFFDEIILCEQDANSSDADKKILDVLSNALDKHRKAMLRFRPFVSILKINSFEAECEKFLDYGYRVGLHAKPISGVGKDNTLESTSESERRAILLTQINKLLEYAPIK
jgi:hypothetical protein